LRRRKSRVSHHRVVFPIDADRWVSEEERSRRVVDPPALLNSAQVARRRVDLPPLHRASIGRAGGGQENGLRGPQRAVSINRPIQPIVVGVDVSDRSQLRREIYSRFDRLPRLRCGWQGDAAGEHLGADRSGDGANPQLSVGRTP
jgi:hypothetical protein